MKLGIIIPTYDSLDTLKVLVKNISDYTTGDYQVYIVEDGQKKKTIEWIKKQDVKAIFHKKNEGVSPSWNDGLREAIKDECTHFAILNDDIELPPKWWDDCKEAFNRKDIHLVSLLYKEEDLDYSFADLHMTGWFFILDRYCIDKVGFFDEQFAPFCTEDDDYWERCKEKKILSARLDLNVFHHGSTTLKKLDKNLYRKVKADNWHKFRNKYPHKKMRGL